LSTAIFCLTKQGYLLGRQIKEILSRNSQEVYLYAPDRDFTAAGQCVRFQALPPAVGTAFARHRRIIFVMALGIVVRMIAGHIKDKTTDPAVVVVDEAGRNVISVLSGHLGGANSLARHVANALGARPVITTATDVRGLPAVDELARERGWALDPPAAVRRVNSAIVNGKIVHFYLPETDTLPDDVNNVKFFSINDYPAPAGHTDYKVIATNRVYDPLPDNTMFLRPRNLVVGVGCRSGITEEKILAAIKAALAKDKRSHLSVRVLATIDRKSGEPGLQKAAQTLKVPLVCFTAAQINDFIRTTPLTMQYSDFVQQKMGVPAVCEPVALLAARKGELILPKQKFSGVTIALAEDQ
jgi:cobalt-precorrin 5A hydrolase